MMRVLIVNKFFYPRGGDCVVAMGTRELLLEAGHEVRVFAMHYPGNMELAESGQFVSQVDFSGSFTDKIKAFNRMMGTGDIVSSFKKVLTDFRPDIVHVHNIHSYLSPVICGIARRAGIPVVWTLHDFKLVCPSYTFRRPDGSICDYAVTHRCGLIGNRCMKGSLMASLMASLEARRWPMTKLNRLTTAYIAPSKFMSDMMEAGGADMSKMNVLYNFIDPAKLRLLTTMETHKGEKESYIAYIGRLSEEKGVGTLIKAAIRSGVTLKIAGDGPMRPALEVLAGGRRNIRFLGKLGAEDVARLQHGADACVCPSEWYENNPLSVIESLCAGTPVIGARIGGIPELITPGVNGYLYTSGDEHELADILKKITTVSFDKSAIAAAAVEKFSTRQHLDQLLNIYHTCLS